MILCSSAANAAWREKVKIALADDFVWIGNIEVLSYRAARAKESPIAVLEVNLIGRVFEQKIEEFFRMRGRLGTRKGG
jgi:hypothetical protein